MRERGGAYLNSKCLLSTGDYYKPLGTAFFVAAVAQLPAAWTTMPRSAAGLLSTTRFSKTHASQRKSVC